MIGGQRNFDAAIDALELFSHFAVQQLFAFCVRLDGSGHGFFASLAVANRGDAGNVQVCRVDLAFVHGQIHGSGGNDGSAETDWLAFEVWFGDFRVRWNRLNRPDHWLVILCHGPLSGHRLSRGG